MYNVNDDLKRDLKIIFKDANNAISDTDENNAVYYVKESIFDNWRGLWCKDLFDNAEIGFFASILVDVFGVKLKNRIKLVFSNAKYKRFLQHEFIHDALPDTVFHICSNSAPRIKALFYGVNDYCITLQGGRVQAYKIHTAKSGRAYIKNKYRRYYLDEYLKD